MRNLRLRGPWARARWWCGHGSCANPPGIPSASCTPCPAGGLSCGHHSSYQPLGRTGCPSKHFTDTDPSGPHNSPSVHFTAEGTGTGKSGVSLDIQDLLTEHLLRARPCPNRGDAAAKEQSPRPTERPPGVGCPCGEQASGSWKSQVGGGGCPRTPARRQSEACSLRTTGEGAAPGPRGLRDTPGAQRGPSHGPVRCPGQNAGAQDGPGGGLSGRQAELAARGTLGPRRPSR